MKQKLNALDPATATFCRGLPSPFGRPLHGTTEETTPQGGQAFKKQRGPRAPTQFSKDNATRRARVAEKPATKAALDKVQRAEVRSSKSKNVPSKEESWDQVNLDQAQVNLQRQTFPGCPGTGLEKTGIGSQALPCDMGAEGQGRVELDSQITIAVRPGEAWRVKGGGPS